ncbi:MAG: hypothetical protein B7X04_00645 [Parcubacteria group bacterium 21-54-25]|nr:MAG: hypothetical protein B7X04_00645 [Parcubacteria group bacterium 21-54-25]HQU07436.1 GTPase ObgE [Candidatus Paceibacterota bacterium]
MAFIDSVTIHATAGKGGNGLVRWLHEKGRPRGGPGGGDGGRGGDVVLVGVRDLAALATYRYTKKFAAENGQSGDGNRRHGAAGAPVLLRVPVGTIAHVPALGRKVEVIHEDTPYVLLTGGAGGFGNAHFKSATHQNPFEATPGQFGEAGSVDFELKLIADAGLIGLPNAGKSSLLNALTRAKSKIGAYPFTTLEPNLGALYGNILADIPGLIEGASGGKGLGTRFLKHIERTTLLVHLVSAEHDDPVAAYQEVRKELAGFGRGLTEKTELVVVSKTDVCSSSVLSTLKKKLETASGKEVLTVSTKDESLLKAFSDRLMQILSKK